MDIKHLIFQFSSYREDLYQLILVNLNLDCFSMLRVILANVALAIDRGQQMLSYAWFWALARPRPCWAFDFTFLFFRNYIKSLKTFQFLDFIDFLLFWAFLAEFFRNDFELFLFITDNFRHLTIQCINERNDQVFKNQRVSNRPPHTLAMNQELLLLLDASDLSNFEDFFKLIQIVNMCNLPPILGKFGQFLTVFPAYLER